MSIASCAHSCINSRKKGLADIHTTMADMHTDKRAYSFPFKKTNLNLLSVQQKTTIFVVGFSSALSNGPNGLL